MTMHSQRKSCTNADDQNLILQRESSQNWKNQDPNTTTRHQKDPNTTAIHQKDPTTTATTANKNGGKRTNNEIFERTQSYQPDNHEDQPDIQKDQPDIQKDFCHP